MSRAQSIEKINSYEPIVAQELMVKGSLASGISLEVMGRTASRDDYVALSRELERLVGADRHGSAWFPVNIRREANLGLAAWANEVINTCVASSSMVLDPS